MKVTYVVIRKSRSGEEREVARFEDTNDQRANAFIAEETVKPENAGCTFAVTTVRDFTK